MSQVSALFCKSRCLISAMQSEALRENWFAALLGLADKLQEAQSLRGRKQSGECHLRRARTDLYPNFRCLLGIPGGRYLGSTSAFVRSRSPNTCSLYPWLFPGLPLVRVWLRCVALLWPQSLSERCWDLVWRSTAPSLNGALRRLRGQRFSSASMKPIWSLRLAFLVFLGGGGSRAHAGQSDGNFNCLQHRMDWLDAGCTCFQCKQR